LRSLAQGLSFWDRWNSWTPKPRLFQPFS